MTEQERIKALEDTKKQIKDLKATINQLNKLVVEPLELYDEQKFKDELKYLSTLINPKYLVRISTESDDITDDLSFGNVHLDMFIKQTCDNKQVYQECYIGLSGYSRSYYGRNSWSRNNPETPEEFCNRCFREWYNNLDQERHQHALRVISSLHSINMNMKEGLYFGLTNQQAKFIKKTMEKCNNAPTATIAIINYILSNFDKVDKRLGIDITAKEIKKTLKDTLKVINKIHKQKLKKNAYID